MADWNMVSPTASDVDYIFSISPALIENVNTTIRDREQFGGEVVDTEALAIEIGGGIYSLGSSFGGTPIAYVNPVLQIPGELAPGIMWNITDGALPGATLKRSEIVSFDLDSGGIPATDYVHVSYTENVVFPTEPIVEEFYFLKGDGLQEEIIVTDPDSPSAIPPIPPTETIWQRTEPVILP